MKYTIYISDSIEQLVNEFPIGAADSYQDACKTLSAWLRDNGKQEEPYWRICLGETATFIDYGSWSKFAVIVPPISMEELCK